MKKLIFLATAMLAVAQTDPHAGHDMSKMGNAMNHGDTNNAENYLLKMASGTGQNPLSWPMPMLMPKGKMPRLKDWTFMIMGQGFLNTTQQSGPRGGDKLYSANWSMVSATHKLGGGAVMLQSMFSLDPATVTNQRYPLLFQTGETAHGVPLTDAQHPHDFFMGLGVQYAHSLGEKTMFQAYYAPVGDPALGPVAFPHRASAFELPQAVISHHLQDSTHIASNVATVAIRHRWLKLEASSFHGTEPDENRWNIDWGAMNSYSGRVSIFPNSNWMAQFSAGRLTDPERQSHQPGDEEHGGDVVRMTSSVHYTRPMGHGNHWSTSVIWGQNHSVRNQRNTNSYLVETLFPVSAKNFLTGRVEVVDKDELFTNNHALEHQLELTAGTVFRVQAYTAGYTRDIGTFQSLQTGLGANVSSYVVPSAIQSFYGQHPWGVNVFLRVRLNSKL